MAAGDQQQQAPRVRECSTCTFWDNSLTGGRAYPTGICRRLAPKASQQFGTIEAHNPTGIMYAGAVWPVTLAGENCGEHKFPVGAAKGAQA